MGRVSFPSGHGMLARAAESRCSSRAGLTAGSAPVSPIHLPGERASRPPKAGSEQEISPKAGLVRIAREWPWMGDCLQE